VWMASLEPGYAGEKLSPKDPLSPPPLAY